MKNQSNSFERFMESAIFASRWILAPFFIGLILAMLVLLLKFGKEMVSLFMGVLGLVEHDAIISILTLVDTALGAVVHGRSPRSFACKVCWYQLFSAHAFHNHRLQARSGRHGMRLPRPAPCSALGVQTL
jgi:hypothetical protein